MNDVGSVNIFMASEPLAGVRFVEVKERKTKSDWAVFIKGIAGRYEDAIRITLVMDNLATHKAGSLYETFYLRRHKRILDRFEFVYTPKHGSWLNMAEIRIERAHRAVFESANRNYQEVAQKLRRGIQYRNNLNATFNWQFTTEKARVKLKRLYPTLMYDMTLVGNPLRAGQGRLWA